MAWCQKPVKKDFCCKYRVWSQLSVGIKKWLLLSSSGKMYWSTFMCSLECICCGSFISQAAKGKGHSVLLNWLKDIVNHFWWCCKMASTIEHFLVRTYFYCNYTCGNEVILYILHMLPSNSLALCFILDRAFGLVF